MATMIEQDGVRTGVAGGALFVATGAFVAAAAPTVVFVLGLLVVVAVGARSLSVFGTLLVAVWGWALATGFGINAFGQLTFEPSDLARLAAFCCVAVLV